LLNIPFYKSILIYFIRILLAISSEIKNFIWQTAKRFSKKWFMGANRRPFLWLNFLGIVDALLLQQLKFSWFIGLHQFFVWQIVKLSFLIYPGDVNSFSTLHPHFKKYFF